jgi:hypothetical protein
MTVMLAGVLLGATALASPAEAGDDGQRGRGRYDRRDRDRDRGWVRDRDWDRDRDWRRDDRRERRYFRDRDVVVIREYYRPYHRPLPPGLAKKYYRHGHLPPGWGRRVRPIPVHIDRHLHVLPRGYRRGIIDGHVVVFNSRGLIVDLAVLFCSPSAPTRTKKGSGTIFT